jgi:MSHA biogenesis protein MshL
MKKIRLSCYVGIGLLLSGCLTSSPHQRVGLKDTRAIDQIHAGLTRDLAVDKTKPPYQNYAMNAALMRSTTQNFARDSVGMEKRFDVSVNNAPAKSFFTGLVAGTPYNMVVSPDITGTVSLKLKNVTVEQVLQAVQDIYGYSYQKTSYGFEILPPSLQTQIFTVNYLDVERSGNSDISLASTSLSSDLGPASSGSSGSNGSSGNYPPGGSGANGPTKSSGSHVTTLSKGNFWPTLQLTLTAMVGTDAGRAVTVSGQSGLVTVRAYPQELQQVAKYLDKIQNNLGRQVILEAKILEVQLNDDYQAGIDWSAIRFAQRGTNLNSPIINGYGFPSGTTPFTNGTSAPVPPGSIGNPGFFSANIGGENFGAIINLLESQGNVQVLSSPRISTVNNQQAVIKVGTDDFFVTSVTSNVTPAGTGNNTNSSSVGLTPFFSGITLDVTPEISASGEIVLHVHPSVSKVIDKVKDINLGVAQGTLSLPLAESTIRESDDVVRAQNGQVIVIGGLMQNDTSEKLASTPWLTRIPFLGALFRHTNQSSTKSELVILLKPTIVNSSVWSDTIQEERNRFCQLDRGYHFGSRPEIFGTRGEVGG